MFILIGNFGSRQRKIHATFQFFMFTMVGSFFMMFAIFLIYLHEGSTDLFVLYFANFGYNFQILLWFCFFISLAVKVPIFPVHIWLPEAHVEAPTVGSVILAGVLLKMGTYGMLRFVFPLFSFANFFMNPFVFLFCFLSIYYVSLITFCQIDLKKLIAYSSIAHMGYVIMGLFTYNFQGIQGSLFLMLSHGLVSSLLFFLVGMLYDRYKTRIVFFYKSIHSYMPLFCLFFFLLHWLILGFPAQLVLSANFCLCFLFLLLVKSFFFSMLWVFLLVLRMLFGCIIVYLFYCLFMYLFLVIFLDENFLFSSHWFF